MRNQHKTLPLNLQSLCKYRFAICFCTAPETEDAYGTWEWLVAASNAEESEITNQLELENAPKPVFGGFQYDWKNEIETELKELHLTEQPFIKFFKPEWWIGKPKNSTDCVSEGNIPEELFHFEEAIYHRNPILFQSNFSKEEYLAAIQKIQAYISEGDCYEVNFAQEWTAHVAELQPAALFKRLLQQSPVPMSVFWKWKDEYYLCISPERFLQLNQNQTLISQPIKGTAKRPADPADEESVINELAHDLKIKAENVMIVDLVRNDLYKSCIRHSVQVPKLFEIQRFANLFHVVSTVTGQKKADISSLEAIKNAFPAGSMTGAPKFRVMERISETERTARGMYAGSIGYLFQETFDFNVVIRTLVWNSQTKILRYYSGGAITSDSDPLQEYDETMLKARFIQQVLETEDE